MTTIRALTQKGPRVPHPTPAMDVLLAALEGTGLHPAVTEDTTPGAAAPWRATIGASLAHLHLDGRPAAADLAGTGIDRDSALRDLLAHITRITYAVHAADLDLTGGSYRWQSLAWSGTRLAVTGHGRAPLQIREVIAA